MLITFLVLLVFGSTVEIREEDTALELLEDGLSASEQLHQSSILSQSAEVDDQDAVLARRRGPDSFQMPPNFLQQLVNDGERKRAAESKAITARIEAAEKTLANNNQQAERHRKHQQKIDARTTSLEKKVDQAPAFSHGGRRGGTGGTGEAAASKAAEEKHEKRKAAHNVVAEKHEKRKAAHKAAAEDKADADRIIAQDRVAAAKAAEHLKGQEAAGAASKAKAKAAEDKARVEEQNAKIARAKAQRILANRQRTSRSANRGRGSSRGSPPRTRHVKRVKKGGRRLLHASDDLNYSRNLKYVHLI